jgi:hypothetical protein
MMLPVSVSGAGSAAIVNGQPITWAQLEIAVQAYMDETGTSIQGIRQPKRFERIQRQALDLIIEQELLLQEAKVRGVTVKQSEMDASVLTVQTRYKSREEFVTRLHITGQTEEGLRKEFRRKLMLQNLIQDEIAKIDIIPARAGMTDTRLICPHRI